MKKEWIQILREFLVTQMNHWVLFTPMAMIMGLAYSARPVLWEWGLCGLLPFLFFFFRVFLDHFWSFSLAHLLSLAGVFLLPGANQTEMWLLRILAAGYVLRSYHIRFRGEKQAEEGIFPLLGVGLSGVCLWATSAHGPAGWENYFVIPLILFLAFHFIRFYMEHYLRFLTVNDSSAGYIPRREIFRSGMRLVLMFTLTGALVLAAVSNTYWLSGLAGWLKGLLIGILRWLFAGRGVEEEPEELLPQEDMVPDQNPFADLETAEPSMFWIILQRIFVTIFTVLVIVALVMALRYLVLILIARFRRRPEVHEEEEEDVVDVREKCKVVRPKRKIPPFLFLQPRERIRRIFQKRVRAGRERILGKRHRSRLEYLTSGECADGLDQKLLAVIYDKARYSEEECTMEDVAALKDEG